MAKPRQVKLKVFQAQFGFFDTVVGAPSQAAALRAWGVHQNLFASGEAKPTTDEAAIAAALQHPETPIRRAVGSNDPFELEPSRLPEVPEASKPPAVKPATRAKPEPLPRPPADRSALDAAEAALRQLDNARKQEEAEIRRKQDELDAERVEAQSAYVERRKAGTAAVVEARRGYRTAGGKD